MHMEKKSQYISGQHTEATSGECFISYNPANGEAIAEIGQASASDVEAAIESAQRGFQVWSAMTPVERSRILLKAVEILRARNDELAKLEVLDTGKPLQEATEVDIVTGADVIEYFAGLAPAMQGEQQPLSENQFFYTRREPLGICAGIGAWNYPIQIAMWKSGPALAAGNALIFKPSEETPATATLLGEVMNECGVPAGVYNVVHGFGGDSAGAFLTAHKDVDAITFTGETKTGEVIMRAASVGLRNISMECGGKNPGIVFADCDMDKAIEGTMRSAFVNCGQVCLGTERVYVERPIFEEFVQRLKEGAEKLKMGRPEDNSVDFGPLVSQEHKEKVLSYYRLAVEEGATVVTGGGIPEMGADLNAGAWVEPTIWTGLADDSRTVTEEIFGPCCHIRPFDTEEEVIELANNTEYGLAATVWTENTSRATRVAESMDVGLVWVNSWFLRDLRTAFGGAKQSGIGREGGIHGLEFYTELKNVCIKL